MFYFLFTSEREKKKLTRPIGDGGFLTKNQVGILIYVHVISIRWLYEDNESHRIHRNNGTRIHFVLCTYIFTRTSCRRFLWAGPGEERKAYNLVNWNRVYISKKEGGMGIDDLKKMNVALLAEWWWKLETESTKLVSKVLRNKYGSKVGSWAHKHRNSSNTSSFWKGLVSHGN